MKADVVVRLTGSDGRVLARATADGLDLTGNPEEDRTIVSTFARECFETVIDLYERRRRGLA